MKISNTIALLNVVPSINLVAVLANTDTNFRRRVQSNNASEWEPAPFMEEGLPGLDSTHTFGFALRGKAYAVTGNVRVPERDFCGDCRGVENVTRIDLFSDAFYSYNPKTGWEDLGPHPGGTRGFAQGDIMDRGTENEILYFGLGQTRSADEDGNDLAIFPRWEYSEDGSYGIVENATAYPRLTDWWSFDGQTWKRLADFPGIGRTHPGVTAENGKVFVGLGFGELCPHEDEDCTTGTGHDDPRGRSGNLQDLWIYDVETDTWEEGTSFSYPVHHPMHFAANGQAYFVAGHNGGIVYNKLWRHNYLFNGTDSWSEMAAIPGVGRVAGTQFDHRGKGYILGGETASRGNNIMDGFPNSVKVGAVATQYPEDHRSMEKNEFWEYDGSTDTWKELAPTPDSGSRWASSSFVLDDYVYNFNGVIRKGHYHLDDNNFSQEWPQQGYRMYIGPKAERDEEDAVDDTLISGGRGIDGAFKIVITLPILLFGWKLF